MKSFTLAQETVNDTNNEVDILSESNVNRSYAYIRLGPLHNPLDLIHYHQFERSEWMYVTCYFHMKSYIPKIKYKHSVIINNAGIYFRIYFKAHL